MFDVQVLAADGTTLWIRVRQASSENIAAARACELAKIETGKRFYPAAVLAAA